MYARSLHPLGQLQAGIVLEEVAHRPLAGVGDEAAAPEVLQKRRIGAEGEVYINKEEMP